MATDMVLRPAWRNYWALILLAVLLLIVGVMIAFTGEREPGTASALMGAAFLLASLLLWLVIFFKRLSWKFVVEEQRVTRHYGIIARNQQSVRIRDLRSVELNQGLFQRLFGIGDLSFYSAGSAEAEVSFHGVRAPEAIRDRVDELADQAKAGHEPD